MQDLFVEDTEIPGLQIIRLTVLRTPEGYFKEHFHRGALDAAGIEGFQPVQHNITHVEKVGVTRGFHSEPWDRLISLVSGRAYGAWVDLRPGVGYGQVVELILDPSIAVLTPRGVANAHQVLEPGTTFSYLLNEHWNREAKERDMGVNLFDPALGVHWPIGPRDALMTERDKALPMLEGSAHFKEPSTQDSGFSFGIGHQASNQRNGNYRVLFVCTANICRSAYADVVASGQNVPGLEFFSAGTHGLAGEGIDPPMAAHAKGKGNAEAHVARQLTRADVDQADLILTMAGDHRRYILDEWPTVANKTFVIGHAAREIGSLPPSARLADVSEHLWNHRSSSSRDDVADPYRRGEMAALKAATTIDSHLDAIIPTLANLAQRSR
ncbi:MAG: dTDP-4-dehydrorhamnose 3,5-epimerase family protein [Flaviflexus sp.]|uniref:dTDP-4-dehydrorhamnose 3,5-epimerase family protein n=1 Tax=Flaviflexus sp. TaxID=1969482 RepID=UPI00352DD2ED